MKKINLIFSLIFVYNNCYTQSAINVNFQVGVGAVTVGRYNYNAIPTGYSLDNFRYQPSAIYIVGVGVQKTMHKLVFGINAQFQQTGSNFDVTFYDPYSGQGNYSTSSKNSFSNLVVAPKVKYVVKKWRFGIQVPFYANLSYKFEKPGLMELGNFANRDGELSKDKRFLYGLGFNAEYLIKNRFSIALEQNISLKKQFNDALLMHSQLTQTNLVLSYYLKKQ